MYLCLSLSEWPTDVILNVQLDDMFVGCSLDERPGTLQSIARDSGAIVALSVAIQSENWLKYKTFKYLPLNYMYERNVLSVWKTYELFLEVSQSGHALIHDCLGCFKVICMYMYKLKIS